MRFTSLLLLFLFSIGSAAAQKDTALYFSESFLPVKQGGILYQGIAKKYQEKWFVEASNILSRTYAVNGWFSDDQFLVKDSTFRWYYANGNLEKIENYKENKFHGVVVNYSRSGMIKDSTYYANGKKAGEAFKWDEEGYLIDSSKFDGMGNGVQVTWYPGGGTVSSTGFWTSDTVKNNTWNYYSEAGKLWGKEIYKDGKITACRCFHEDGSEMDSAKCGIRSDAKFPGKPHAWTDFLKQNLNMGSIFDRVKANIDLTVIIKFVVDENGNLGNFEAETKHGFGTEEEAIRVLKLSPKWIPAFAFGRYYNTVKRQPVRFIVQGF